MAAARPEVRRAWIGLGANLDDPPAQLRAALRGIAALESTRLLTVSSFYRSAPLPVPGQADDAQAQPDYCNAVCAVETGLNPQRLLIALQELEAAAGRVRGARWSARRLDLDLLHVEGVQIQTAELVLPHPEMARRNFVLVPLADIAPELDIPGLGRIADLARAAGRAALGAWPE